MRKTSSILLSLVVISTRAVQNYKFKYKIYKILLVYVTGPDKTSLITLFCISRNTDFNIEWTVLLRWLDTVTPDILYNKSSYIASYHFIAISTIWIVFFSACNITD